MARDNKGFVCHSHKSLTVFHMHHVWPREYRGPNTKDNLIKICPNAHYDIHDLLDRMLAGKPYNLKEYGPNIRKYALRGYKEVTAYLDAWASILNKQ